MHLTTLDLALAILLLAGLPAWQLWRSLRAGDRPRRPRMSGYLRSSAMIALLLGLLAATWIEGARPLAALGLDVPVGMPGLVGLAIAAALLGGLLVAGLTMKAKADAPVADFLPQTRGELAFFPVMAVLIGCGWELLYRGFLLWALTPLIGEPLAIAAAATAYGVAHGYKSAFQLGAGIAMALVFTIAYALSDSLWWLMLIHTALPLFALIGRPRGDRAAVTT